MVFLAHITCYDNIEQKDCYDRIALVAENFTHAMEQIEEAYSKDMITAITYLEPISDSNLIYLNEDAEDMIKDNPYNEF